MAWPNNESVVIPAPTQTDKVVFEDGDDATMTHAKMLLILRILMYGINPGIGVLGVIGNIFSIIILIKHGLHKCSNILLIALAFADICYLVAFNNAPKILLEVVGVEHHWEGSREATYVLFIFYNIFNILDYGMGSCSLTIPMLITIERLVAVFLPFKVNLIVTPFRTWCAVAFVFIFWNSMYAYSAFWFSFDYVLDPMYNVTVGSLSRSAHFYANLNSVDAVSACIDYLAFKIPPAITLVGSICIIGKVNMAARQRKKMQGSGAKEASSNRTTKMLLMVCGVYIVTCATLSLPVYFPTIMHWSLTGEPTSNLGRVIYQLINVAACANSSVNFIIYVGMNKNFRDTYKSLFTSCTGPKK